jgi:adenosylcobinamide-GDP ribazoletransferase
MSRMNVIKVFRDLLAFLTVVPLGKTEDFVENSARNMWLFPVVGGLIGLLAAGYFFASGFILSYLLLGVNFLLHIPTDFLQGILPPIMTLAFLLVFTGFQHFDGLIDLGNALGLRKMEERREIAHRWVVTYQGALLALFVEFSAVVGLFLLNVNVAWRALVLAEVCAKLAMLSIVWRGKAAHQGLGSRFIDAAKRNVNVAGYTAAFLIGFALLGVAGLLMVLAAALFGAFMEKVAIRVFGGVSGDMIGATNEAARALSLVLTAVFAVLVSSLLWGALFL